MKAIILAAGVGKRMKSNKAKVLHSVIGKPMLGCLIDALACHNLDESFIVVGHNGNQVEDYLKAQNFSNTYKTVYQEPLLGTGHALMQVAPHLKKYESNILVLNGDMPLISAKSIASLIEEHLTNQNDLTLLTSKTTNPSGFGRIVRDFEDKLTSIVEENDANLDQKQIKEVNLGIYCFSWTAIAPGLNDLKPNNEQAEYYITDLIKWAKINNLKIGSYTLMNHKEACGVNSRADLALANRYMSDLCIENLQENGVTIIDPSSTWIGPDVRIGQDSIIFPNTTIFNDVIIGKNCLIGPASHIEGDVSIGNDTEVKYSYLANCSVGNNCTIGPFTNLRVGANLSDFVRIGNFVEIKASCIDNNSNVSHLSYIGDTNIGAHSNIGAGTITANYNHLTKEKSKTQIGSNVSIGSNTVLVAPVSVGDSAVVGAGTVVTKEVPQGSLAVGRSPQINRPDWVLKKIGAKK